MSSYTSDQSLAEGLAAGRRDAFARLYADQHAAIYNLCARILGDREEAEDVTHDTFITAFSKPPEATGEVKLRPWLYRVATNACFNRLRSRKHVGGDGELIAAVPDGVDGYQRAETAALVEASLATMNERYRTALVLKDLHGLPPAEIAEVMQVSRPAADVLVHRARGAFKSAFAKLGGSTPAPANLGLALAPLTVPAALHAMPPLPHPVLPAHPVAPHAVPHAAGPAGAGLLSKIGASLGAKAAIGAAAAAVVIGGGVIALKEAGHGTPAKAAGAGVAPTTLTSDPRPAARTGSRHDARLAGHDAQHGCHDGAAADEAGHHAGGHASDACADSTTHVSGDTHTSTTSHDAATAGSMDTADHASSTTTSTSSTTHDGGGHDGGGHDGGGMDR